jgi:hypothetical protein
MYPFIAKGQDEDEDDEDEAGLSIQESAYKASAAVAESVGTVSHSIFTSFITNTIHAAEWEKRKAAVLSFGALAEFAENDAVRMLVLSAIKVVLMSLSLGSHPNAQRSQHKSEESRGKSARQSSRELPRDHSVASELLTDP